MDSDWLDNHASYDCCGDRSGSSFGDGECNSLLNDFDTEPGGLAGGRIRSVAISCCGNAGDVTLGLCNGNSCLVSTGA